MTTTKRPRTYSRVAAGFYSLNDLRNVVHLVRDPGTLWAVRRDGVAVAQVETLAAAKAYVDAMLDGQAA